MWWWSTVRFGRRRVTVFVAAVCVGAAVATVMADEIKSWWRLRSNGGGGSGGSDGVTRRESCSLSPTAVSSPSSNSRSTPQTVSLGAPSFSSPPLVGSASVVAVVVAADRTPPLSVHTAAAATAETADRKVAVDETTEAKRDDDASLAADREIRAALAKMTGPGGVMAALVPLELLRTRLEAGCDDSACIVLCAIPGCAARVVVRVLAFDDAQLAEARARLSPLRDARHGAVESTLAALLPAECRHHLPAFYGTYSVAADPFLLGTLTAHQRAEFRREHAIAADQLPGFRVYEPRAAIRLSCTVMEYVPFSVVECVDHLYPGPVPVEPRVTTDVIVAAVARALADLQRVCDFRHNDLHKWNVRLRRRPERTGSGVIFLKPGSVALIDPDYMCARFPASPSVSHSSNSSSSSSSSSSLPSSSSSFPSPPSLQQQQVCGPCIASADAEPPGSTYRRRVFEQWHMTPLDAPLRAWYDLATFARSCDLLSLGRPGTSASAEFFNVHGVEWSGVRPHRVVRPFSAADYARYADDPVAYLARMRRDTVVASRAAAVVPKVKNQQS